jgi:LysM repeat protein
MMKKLIALFIGASAILLGASMADANQIGEAVTDEKPKTEETSTLPPSHEIGEPEFEGELGESGAYHEVKKGDSLWKIAGQYKVDFKEVLKLNTHLADPDLIYPHELIELPSNQVQGIQEAYKKYN